MVNFSDKTHHERINLRPKTPITRLDIFFTFFLLVLFSVVGAFLGMLFGKTFHDEPFWMTLIPATSALVFGLANNPESAAGRTLNRVLTILSRRYQTPPPGGWPVKTIPRLMAALIGGVISGILVSVDVLEGVPIHPRLLLHPDYGTPLRLWVGGLSGAAVFIFRPILLAQWGVIALTVRRWTTRNVFVSSARTPKTPKEVEGVYWQCLACHNRLSFNRKHCPCGKSLNPFSFFAVQRFWVHYRYPDGNDQLEFAFASEALFANFRMKWSQVFRGKKT